MKEYVKPSELLKLINSLIESDADCQDCEVAGPVIRLKRPESDGANWSPDLIVRGHGTDPVPCSGPASEAIRQVRTKFAIRSEDGFLEDLVFEYQGSHFLAVCESGTYPDQAWWYVSVDGGPQDRAFERAPGDRDTESLRGRIIAWWAWTKA